MPKKKMGEASKVGFPTFAVILLVVAVIWLFSELGYIAIDVPWIPIILGIVAIGMIANRYSKK